VDADGEILTLGEPMNRMDVRSRAWAVGLLLGAGVLLCGCAGRHKAVSDVQAGNTNRADALVLVGQAQRAEASGHMDEAIALYEQAVETWGSLAGAWNELGLLRMEKGNYLEAADAMRIAAELAPNDPKPLENLGLVYHRAGYDQKALKYYEQALERNPNRIEALRGIVRVANRLHLADESILAHVNHALLLESDPTWRQVFERERVRIRGQLRSRDEIRFD
jgi:tetratricopeptide (TPR) repeat protein